VTRVSVVVNTYNRAAQVGNAIQSVLSQTEADLELIVVDDGSSDDTPAVLADVTDPRMRCIRQTNRGLSASRNVGARAARGQWLLFLDDDDRLCAGALEALLTAATGPACRVVVGGVRFVDRTGHLLQERAPSSSSVPLAGSFLIDRHLFHEAGGYLEGIPCSHQTEMFVRVNRILDERKGSISYVTQPVVQIERRPAAGRPEQSPAHTYFGARWLLARHPEHYGGGRSRADLETLAGVNAMRIRREAEAPRRLLSAIRHDPLAPRRYARLAGAVVRPVGRRLWLRQWDTAPETPRLLDRAGSLFTPWRYHENPLPTRGDRDATGEQTPLRRYAARFARARNLTPVVDIPGDEVAWDEILTRRPKLIVCCDVVQCTSDPRRLLSGIRRALGEDGMALISTVDRDRLGPAAAMGPPTDPRHIRQWSADGFGLLLESCGFDIIRVVRRTPRRSVMGFLVRAAQKDPGRVFTAFQDDECAANR
jgi:hypothetical protein